MSVDDSDYEDHLRAGALAWIGMLLAALVIGLVVVFASTMGLIWLGAF